MAPLIDSEFSKASSRGAASPLAAAKRVVVKIGSALLVDEKRSEVHRTWLETVAADIATMKARGQEVVVVTSGSIAVGRRHLGLPSGSLKLEEKQAAAAMGQGRLAHAYQETFAEHGVKAAQVLLTIGDTEDRRRYLNGPATPWTRCCGTVRCPWSTRTTRWPPRKFGLVIMTGWPPALA